MKDTMGQFGWKTYEGDYIEDLLFDFNLMQDFREGKPLTIGEVKEILDGEGNEEVYLGIVSFLIDEWESPHKLIPKECLEIALKYAEGLLKSYTYASQWLYDWNDRIEALGEEMGAIEKILNPSVPFDFSKYDKIDQDVFFELSNWEKFDENDKFGLIDYLSKYPNPKALIILKGEMSKDLTEKEDDTTTRMVLIALALSQLDGEDAIDIILENSHDLINSIVEERIEDYLKSRLDYEKNYHISKIIE